MNEPRQCARCGREISWEARWGLCPRCLLSPEQEDPTEPSSEGASVTGECFADYELVRPLGRGGMGEVFEARHLTLHRTVALKRIIESCNNNPGLRRRFTIEAEAAAKLDHRHIVPVYDFGEHQGKLYLSMKLVRGETLKTKLSQKNNWPARDGDEAKSNGEGKRDHEAALVRFLALVARAVHHAHLNGVVHRDLKPGNIIVNDDGEPFVTDFGLAKIVDPLEDEESRSTPSVPGVIMGSPPYMSPEQALGRPVTVASDVYSLGAIFYEMLTGEPPFKGKADLETIKLVLEKEAKPPRLLRPGIHRELETICMGCLEKRPGARYASAEALAEDLERWLNHEPIKRKSCGPLIRLGRWVQRNPLGASLIVSLCLCLVISGFLLKYWKGQIEKAILVRQKWAERIVAEIRHTWPFVDYVEFSSADLAILGILDPRKPDPGTANFILAFSVDEDPVSQAIQCAPFVRAMEERMERLLHRRVEFTLRLYKRLDSDIQDPLIGGQVDFYDTSALRFLKRQQVNPGITPVAQYVQNKWGVIYARQELGISNLTQIAGLRLALAYPNSIISFLAKKKIVRAGITPSRLAKVTIFSAPVVEVNRLSPFSVTNHTPNFYAHEEVLRSVLDGDADVGAARQRDFLNNRSKKGGLVAIDTYKIPANLFVARTDLDTNVIRAFQQCLISKDWDPRVINGLSGTHVEGFTRVDQNQLDNLRKALTNEIQKFEAELIPPSPASEASE